MLKSSSFKTHSLYQLINDATDNLLRSEDENLNKRICSEILRTSDGPKVAAKIINKIITKSLSSHYSQSIWYCLLLLDLAVKSTDLRFGTAVLSKDFFGDLVKIMDLKYQVPEFVQEKFLYILKEWNSSLIEVPGHSNLAKFYKNQMSPPVPNITIPGVVRSYSTDQSSLSYGPAYQQGSPVVLDKDKIIRDIDIIETNLSVFSDTLRTIDPGKMTSEESQFLKELHETVKKMQARINDIIPMTVWEDVTNQLLQVNDKINSTSERYIRLMSTVTRQLLVTGHCGGRVHEPVDEAYDTTYAVVTTPNNNNNRVVPEMYDIPSLPSYNEASTNLSKINRTPVSQELNLISFDDESSHHFYNKQPLPPIPLNGNKDILTEPINESMDTQNNMTSDEFDNFIESIARRHKPAPPSSASLDEEYAPPLYDEASINKHSATNR